LVVGSPRESSKQVQLPTEDLTIHDGRVEDVWLALNIESLISGVGKNWKNRGEDIYVFYLGVYENYNLAATGSIVILNISDLEDRDPEEMLTAFQEFDFADGSIAQTIDSLAVIPLDYDESTPAETELAEQIVPVDHPLHYQNFVRVMAESLVRRVEGEFEVSSASLESVLAEAETEVLEFKEELDDVSDIAKEAVAFANHDGGAILLGVADNGSIQGLDAIDSAEERVAGILDKVDPAVTKNIEKATYEGNDILIVNILRTASVPASYNGTFYVRQGTTKTRMTGQELIQRFPRE
jgi:hypothetical protein